MGCGTSTNHKLSLFREMPIRIRLLILVNLLGRHETFNELADSLNESQSLGLLSPINFLEELSDLNINIISDFTYSRDFFLKTINTLVNCGFIISFERGGVSIDQNNKFFEEFLENVISGSRTGLKLTIKNKSHLLYEAIENTPRVFLSDYSLVYKILFHISSHPVYFKTNSVISILVFVEKELSVRSKDDFLYLYRKIPNLFGKYHYHFGCGGLKYLLYIYNRIWRVKVNGELFNMNLDPFGIGSTIFIGDLEDVVIGETLSEEHLP